MFLVSLFSPLPIFLLKPVVMQTLFIKEGLAKLYCDREESLKVPLHLSPKSGVKLLLRSTCCD